MAGRGVSLFDPLKSDALVEKLGAFLAAKGYPSSGWSFQLTRSATQRARAISHVTLTAAFRLPDGDRQGLWVEQQFTDEFLANASVPDEFIFQSFAEHFKLKLEERAGSAA